MNFHQFPREARAVSCETPRTRSFAVKLGSSNLPIAKRIAKVVLQLLLRYCNWLLEEVEPDVAGDLGNFLAEVDPDA